MNIKNATDTFTELKMLQGKLRNWIKYNGVPIDALDQIYTELNKLIYSIKN